jgi:hypothetical protein
MRKGAVVLMPKAPVHEDDFFPGGKDKVGLARKV